MNVLSRLVATLDTNGGHIIVCLALVPFGAFLLWAKVPHAEDLFVGATAALFLSMRGRGSENHDTGKNDPGNNV